MDERSLASRLVDARTAHKPRRRGRLRCFVKGAAFLALLSALPATADAQRVIGTSGDQVRPSQPAPQQPAVEPVITRQNVFGIPITIHQHPQQITELQLLHSIDGGQNWEFYQRRLPTDQEFLFQAEHDGEHCFAMRTIDRNQQAHPAGPPRPELVIVIDSQKPQLGMEAFISGSGSVITRWEAIDPHLVPSSFKLSYRAASELLRHDAEWRELKTSHGFEDHLGHATGELNWWPEIEAKTIDVRAEVRDSADNVTVITRRIEIPRVAQQLRTGPRRGGLGGTRQNGSVGWPSEIAHSRQGLDSTDGQQSRTISTAPQTSSRLASSRQLRDEPQGGFEEIPTPQPLRLPNTDSNPISPTDDRSSLAPTERQALPRADVSSTSDANRAGSNNLSIVRDEVKLPAGEYALLTNHRSFKLSYEVDAVKQESIEKVELWITRDGGNHWEFWADDPDHESPFPVVVPEEGIFGFKIVVTSREGFTGDTPQPGELADLWVEVDLTRPSAEIVAAPLGTGPDSGKLLIEWTADDRKLAARPISLFYSESLNGPWKVVAAGVDNHGTYAWPIDSTIPKRIFLRLEARDRAGNVVVHDLTTPVDLSRLNPRGRIRGLELSDDRGLPIR